MAPRYGIQFYPCGQIYYFTSPDTVLTPGTPVVVDTGHAENLGTVVRVVGAKPEGGLPAAFAAPESAGPEREAEGQSAAAGGDAGADNGAEGPGGEELLGGNGSLDAARDLAEVSGREEADSEGDGQELSAILSEALNPDSPNLSPIKRIAGPNDLERAEQNIAYAAKAGKYCMECAAEHRLDMKLVHTDVSLDGGKLIFFFTAPGRIDFRELVKALARNFHARIELRQIGVRHETQLVGAIGNCGMVCCCRRYMRKFAPVTIKMAKEQGLFLNPVKISGTCGRLLCCLSFEQHNYEEFHGRCPKLGKKYETKRGIFKVLRASLFRNSLTLLPEEGDELEVTLDEWRDMEPVRYDAARRQKAERAEREARTAAEGADGYAARDAESAPDGGGRRDERGSGRRDERRDERRAEGRRDERDGRDERSERRDDRRDERGRGRRGAGGEESSRSGPDEPAWARGMAKTAASAAAGGELRTAAADRPAEASASAAGRDAREAVKDTPEVVKDARAAAKDAPAEARRKDTGLSRFLAAASGDDDDE